MSDRASIEKLVSEVLDNTELRLKVDRYTLEENLENGEVIVRCEVHDEHTGAAEVIEGRGVGIVHAFLRGLLDRYSDSFPSLHTIKLSDFSIAADVDTGRESAKSDMAATVTLRVVNSNEREFAFEHSSPSITRSSIAVVLQSVEFFVDCERAFITLYKALEHAKAERRADSIARYTSQMSILVEATSYSEVIEQIRKETLDK